jgi:hypothetical protein
MSIIIPSTIDENSVRIPMQFPLRPDVDTVLDAEGRVVLTISDSIATAEAIKFAKLFAKAPDMFQLLGNLYGALHIIAMNTEGFDHGSPDEKDKDKCLLCQAEEILSAVK